MPFRTSATPASMISRAARSVILASLLCLPAISASAKDLVVRYDQSQLLRLSRPASAIIVGNPSIADVTLQDGNLLVVTGKTFGITNIIALDANQKIIKDQRVLVERDDRRVVNLHKGSTRYTYACTPNCEPTLTIGDDTTFFKAVKDANASKRDFSEGSADSTNGSQ